MTEPFSSLLSYNPVTGVLTWMESRGTVRKGAAAGSLQTRGYLQVRIGGKSYLAHRIAWLLHYGEWPVDQVDHVNGVRTDNRIENLRAADNSQNQANKAHVYRRNCRGAPRKGTYRIGANRWTARITVKGVAIKLGEFTTTELAHEACMTAAQKHFGEFARSR